MVEREAVHRGEVAADHDAAQEIHQPAARRDRDGTHDAVRARARIEFIIHVARCFVVQNRHRRRHVRAQQRRVREGIEALILRAAQGDEESLVALAQGVVENRHGDGAGAFAGHEEDRARTVGVRLEMVTGEVEHVGNGGVVQAVCRRAVARLVRDRNGVDSAADAPDHERDVVRVFDDRVTRDLEFELAFVVHDHQHGVGQHAEMRRQTRIAQAQVHRLVALEQIVVVDFDIDGLVGFARQERDVIAFRKKVRRPRRAVGHGEEHGVGVGQDAAAHDIHLAFEIIFIAAEARAREIKRRVLVDDVDRGAPLPAELHAARGVGQNEADGLVRLDQRVVDDGNGNVFRGVAGQEGQRAVGAEVVHAVAGRATDEPVVHQRGQVEAAAPRHGDERGSGVLAHVETGGVELNRSVVGDQNDRRAVRTADVVASFRQHREGDGFGRFLGRIVDGRQHHRDAVAAGGNRDRAVGTHLHVVIAARRRAGDRERNRERTRRRAVARDDELRRHRPRLVGARNRGLDRDRAGFQILDGQRVRGRRPDEGVGRDVRDEHVGVNDAGVRGQRPVGHEARRVKERDGQRLVPAGHVVVQDEDRDGIDAVLEGKEHGRRLGRRVVDDVENAGGGERGEEPRAAREKIDVVHVRHGAAASDAVFDLDRLVGFGIGRDLHVQVGEEGVFGHARRAQHEPDRRQAGHGIIIDDAHGAVDGVAKVVVGAGAELDDHGVLAHGVTEFAGRVVDGGDVDVRGERAGGNDDVGADGRVVRPFPRRSTHIEEHIQAVGRRPGARHDKGRRAARLGDGVRRPRKRHGRQRAVKNRDGRGVLVENVVGRRIGQEHGDGARQAVWAGRDGRDVHVHAQLARRDRDRTRERAEVHAAHGRAGDEVVHHQVFVEIARARDGHAPRAAAGAAHPRRGGEDIHERQIVVHNDHLSGAAAVVETVGIRINRDCDNFIALHEQVIDGGHGQEHEILPRRDGHRARQPDVILAVDRVASQTVAHRQIVIVGRVGARNQQRGAVTARLQSVAVQNGDADGRHIGRVVVGDHHGGFGLAEHVSRIGLKPDRIGEGAGGTQFPAGNADLVRAIDIHRVGDDQRAIGGEDVGDHRHNPKSIGLEQQGQNHRLVAVAHQIVDRSDVDIHR